MKKLLILLLILSIFFLSGCGLYNLGSFVLPDDVEFLALIEELDTPEKICQYMLDNFETEEHPYISLTPYQLYITQKGDCDDLANFAMFISNYHGYETYLALMYFDVWHAIAIFKEGSCYTFSELQFYNPSGQCHTSFADIMQIYNGWREYIVYDYDMNIVEQTN